MIGELTHFARSRNKNIFKSLSPEKALIRNCTAIRWDPVEFPLMKVTAQDVQDRAKSSFARNRFHVLVGKYAKKCGFDMNQQMKELVEKRVPGTDTHVLEHSWICLSSRSKQTFLPCQEFSAGLMRRSISPRMKRPVTSSLLLRRQTGVQWQPWLPSESWPGKISPMQDQCGWELCDNAGFLFRRRSQHLLARGGCFFRWGFVSQPLLCGSLYQLATSTSNLHLKVAA